MAGTEHGRDRPVPSPQENPDHGGTDYVVGCVCGASWRGHTPEDAEAILAEHVATAG